MQERFLIMSDLLVTAAFVAFLAFLAAGRYRTLPAIAGWGCIILNLWSEVPALFVEDNFLYPLLALLALPFLAITIERLIREDPIVLQLTRTAAIAAIVYTPFTLVSFLHDALVAFVVTLAFALITFLGHHPIIVSWDVIAENGFYNQIILGCTGIMAIAMMLGLVFGERSLTRRQAVLGFLFVVFPIFILNLLRVVVIFIAISDTWFAGFPDPTGTGDPNFFWSHNVFAEGLAILFLLILVLALARVIPRLNTFARDLWSVYLGWFWHPAAKAGDDL